MYGKFSLYRFFYIINILALFVLLFFFISALLGPSGSNVNWLIFALFLIGVLICLINDLAGLSIIRRLRENKDISWTITNRLIIAVFIQFCLQLLLAYQLTNIFITLYSFSASIGQFSLELNSMAFGVLITMIIIFVSGTFNLFSTIRLIALARKIQNENKEAIESIGSGK